MATATDDTTFNRFALEDRLGVKLVKCWDLEGAGPARYGWWALHPCKREWVGATLSAVSAYCDERFSQQAAR